MITHPEFIYVPLPSAPSPLSTTTRPSKSHSRRLKTAEEKQTTLLQTFILPLLQQRGLIAETLTSTQKSWQGIIRMPEQLGVWGDRADRIADIENMEGRFRRMSIKWVVSCILFYNSYILIISSQFRIPQMSGGVPSRSNRRLCLPQTPAIPSNSVWHATERIRPLAVEPHFPKFPFYF